MIVRGHMLWISHNSVSPLALTLWSSDRWMLKQRHKRGCDNLDADSKSDPFSKFTHSLCTFPVLDRNSYKGKREEETRDRKLQTICLAICVFISWENFKKALAVYSPWSSLYVFTLILLHSKKSIVSQKIVGCI